MFLYHSYLSPRWNIRLVTQLWVYHITFLSNSECTWGRRARSKRPTRPHHLWEIPPNEPLALFFRWLWELISKIGDLLMILRFNVGLGSPAPLFTSAGKDHPCLQWRCATAMDCLCICLYVCMCRHFSLMFSIGKAMQRQFSPPPLSWEPTPRAEKISQHWICTYSKRRLVKAFTAAQSQI